MMSPGILFVAPWLFDGGVERVMEQKARWFAARGYRVRIAVAQLRATLSGHPNPVLARFKTLGIPVTVLPVYGPRLHITQRALGTTDAAGMPIDVIRRGEELIVRFDLPGVPADKIGLTVENRLLTVTAERHAARTGSEASKTSFPADRP